MLSSLACEGTHPPVLVSSTPSGKSLKFLHCRFLNRDILDNFSMLTLHLWLRWFLKYSFALRHSSFLVRPQTSPLWLFPYFVFIFLFLHLSTSHWLFSASFLLVFIYHNVFLLPEYPCFIFPSIRKPHAPRGREPSLATCPHWAACALPSVQGQLEKGDQQLGLMNYDQNTNSSHLSAAFTATAGKNKDKNRL